MPPPPTALQPDDLVDQYKVLRLLERGGSAEVYLARDTRLGRRVALKLLAPGQPQQEARAIARLSHPHIITVYGDGEHDGRPYLALEHLEGQTLRQRLGSGLGVQEGLRLALEAAEALEHAHAEGVVHCDLKPENLQIGADGRLRVLDFGLAARSGEAPSGRIRGTPAYMAPERWRGDAVVAAEDIWALGCCLREVFCSARPYADLSADLRADLNADLDAEDALRAAVTSEEPVPEAPAGGDDLPAELKALLRRCLDKQPNQRPDAAEIRGLMTRLLRPQAAAAVQDERSPFVGLRHFEEQDAALFFGREDEVGGFVERLRSQTVLSITGPSGAGKTSFIRAGVLPRLREQGRWTALHVRPGRRPLLALAGRLAALLEARDGDAATQSLNLEEALTAEPALLSLLLEQIAAERGCSVLLVVDPLEDLCTLCADDEERARFMEAVCGAALDGSGPARIVLAFRDDYLSRLSTSEAARRALTRLTLLQRPVCLPPLQFTARQLWERRDREAGILRRADYEALGGVAGALAGHADGVLAALPDAEQALARDLLLRLVTVEGTRRVVPQAEALEGLPRRATAVLDRLIQGRLVVIRRADPSAEPQNHETDQDHAEVELVHESLVTSWERLGTWLQRGRENRAVLDEAEQAARLWQRRDSPDEGLWSGDELAEAERAARRHGAVVQTVERFLAASRGHEDARSRRAWRLRLGAALVALVLISALVINALTGTERQRIRAEDEASRAVRRWAEARIADAERALEAGQRLTARAHLRAALELRDDQQARALWWKLARDQRVWRRAVGSPVTSLAVAADGTVAAAGHNGRVVLLDGSGRIMRQNPSPEVTAIEPFAATLHLVTRGAAARKRLRRAVGPAARALGFSPDGRWLAVGEREGTIRILRLPGGQLARQLKGHRGEVRQVHFRPDGEELASAGLDGAIRLWRLSPGPPRARPPLLGHGVGIQALAYSPDGEQLASGGADGVVRIWHRRTGRARSVLSGPASAARQLGFSTDGRLLVVAHDGGEIRIWDTRSGQAVERWRRPHGAGPVSAVFSPGSPARIVTAGQDGAICSRALHPIEQAAGHRGPVLAVAAGGGGPGTLVVSAGRDHTVRTWDAARPRQRRLLVGHTRPVLSAAVDPSGALIASGDAAGRIRIWDAASGAERRVLSCGGRALALRFAPGSPPRLAAGCADGRVRLWDVNATASPRELDGHRAAILDLAFDPSGQLLTSASADATLRTWNVSDGRQLRVLAGHRGRVTGVTVGGDGAIISVGDDGRALIWRGPTWQPRPLASDLGRAPVVASLSDGRYVIASRLGGVKICAPPGASPSTCVSLGAIGTSPGPTALATAGALFVFGYELGSLDLWTAAAGAAPRPRWRPPTLLKHPSALWAHGSGKDRCIWTTDHDLSIWRGDKRLGRRRELASLDSLLTVPQGCLTRAGRRAELLTPGGGRVLISDSALAVTPGPTPDTFSVAEADALITVDRGGKRIGSRKLGIGASALLARRRGGLAVGYADGTVELQDAKGKVEIRHTSRSSSPVSVLFSGAAGLLLSGHADGTLVGWQPGGHAPLKIAALLGPIIQIIARDDGGVVITSAAGDQRTVELSALQQPYCALMRAVWRASEVVWEGRRAVRRAPPEAHRCRRRRTVR